MRGSEGNRSVQISLECKHNGDNFSKICEDEWQ
jgi:hypothetical protein